MQKRKKPPIIILGLAFYLAIVTVSLFLATVQNPQSVVKGILLTLMMAVISGFLFWRYFHEKKDPNSEEPRLSDRAKTPIGFRGDAQDISGEAFERMMTSQLAALADQYEEAANMYRLRLGAIMVAQLLSDLEQQVKGEFTAVDEAIEKLFSFEKQVCRNWPSPYLLREDFTNMNLYPFRDLKEPDFIMEHQCLTISELSKIIDEAEWCYYNLHERGMPEEDWYKICQWRLKGPGGDFGIRYCEKISQQLDIPLKMLSAYVNHEGKHLDKYKWSTMD